MADVSLDFSYIDFDSFQSLTLAAKDTELTQRALAAGNEPPAKKYLYIVEEDGVKKIKYDEASWWTRLWHSSQYRLENIVRTVEELSQGSRAYPQNQPAKIRVVTWLNARIQSHDNSWCHLFSKINKVIQLVGGQPEGSQTAALRRGAPMAQPIQPLMRSARLVVAAKKEPPAKTQLAKEVLEKELQKTKKKLGTAVDNGDCYYAALVTEFNRARIEKDGKKITVAMLRQIVADAVNELHRANPENNWVRHLAGDEYERRLLLGDKTWEQLKESEKGSIVWGSRQIDGQIIADYFKVKVEEMTLNDLSSNLSEPVIAVPDNAVRHALQHRAIYRDDGGEYFTALREECEEFGEIAACAFTRVEGKPDKMKALVLSKPYTVPVGPTTGEPQATLSIANYPGHFVPII